MPTPAAMTELIVPINDNVRHIAESYANIVSDGTFDAYQSYALTLSALWPALPHDVRDGLVRLADRGRFPSESHLRTMLNGAANSLAEWVERRDDASTSSTFDLLDEEMGGLLSILKRLDDVAA